MTSTRTRDEDSIYDVIVIGSGFSGLGLAIALKREQRHRFVVLERGADVGGTWRDNTYPGAACDIPSHLYSYSFRQKADWKSVYAKQPEIFAYLQSAANDEGVRPHIHFGTKVKRAAWDETRSLWRVETEQGPYLAKALVSAAGHLSDPAFPEIEGLDSYRGRIMHSAQWDHSLDLARKRVGVVGTGASAIQIVPELAKVVDSLTVFQRSAPYVVPRRDPAYSAAEQRMFARLPQAAQQLRDELFWFNEGRFLQRRRVPSFISIVSTMAQTHLDAQVQDPELKRKVTPDYEIGCKRILISNDYYPALQRPNVSLETSGIERGIENGVVTRDGVSYEFDAIILATGFEATDLPIAEVIHGCQGTTLAESWRSGPEAFACASMTGFPNFFMMLGPNTGLGAGSMVFMAETQTNYIREALNHLLERQIVIEPNAEAQRDYVGSIDSRSQGTVWVAGGCKSWYLHPTSGKLTALWPDFMRQFRAENGSFSSRGYDERATESQI
ncbi:flavin-containing monooxygenase [Bosea sp. 2KB_26]|uniref:flavin-containing monooxygenase n=1 Tax=Bosea sp. 2KB_26 TaxID=3237475 RepID=UPI003F907654